MTAATTPESEHRRGLVLGLTLAEILLLLLFMLLLALGAQIKHLVTKLATEEEHGRTLEATIVELSPLVVELKRNGLLGSETIKEIVVRLGTVRKLEERLRDLEARNKELGDRLSLLSSVNAEAISPENSPGLRILRRL
jgi:hypothetical protein